MLVLVLLGVFVTAGLLLARGGEGDGDLPARIVAIAATWLPARLRPWGQAMAAELPHVGGPARRWRFAAGVLRVAMFPPLAPACRRRTLVTALAGLLAVAAATVAAATVAAATEVPSMSVFVAVLGVALCGYATVLTSRSAGRRRPTVPGALAGSLSLAGVAAAIVAAARIAIAHPAATSDGTHVYSVLFALVLAGYLAFALTPSRLEDRALWWAAGAALAAAAATTLVALAAPATGTGVTGLLWPAGAVAVLAASIGAAAATHSGSAGARAGLLTAVLTAPMHFAADLTALLQAGHFTLTTPYDIAAYPHSGYPDVASYLLSDAIAGNIIGGLVLFPIVLLVLARFGAAAATRSDPGPSPWVS